MTIDEIRSKKEDLELELFKLIDKFENEIGMQINAIGISRETQEGYDTTIESWITIDIKI